MESTIGKLWLTLALKMSSKLEFASAEISTSEQPFQTTALDGLSTVSDSLDTAMEQTVFHSEANQ